MNNDIILIDGKFYKECEVVMLPTEKAMMCTITHHSDGEVEYLSAPNHDAFIYEKDSDITIKPQNLYFLSLDKSKSIDSMHNISQTHGWYYVVDEKGINETDFSKNGLWFYAGGGYYTSKYTFQKIIATTDKSLYETSDCPFRGGISSVRYTPPRPSNEFIEKYCELGGIDKVLVEYEGIEWLDKPLQYFPKVSQKNTINIK